jgi:hypothetical protein
VCILKTKNFPNFWPDSNSMTILTARDCITQCKNK